MRKITAFTNVSIDGYFAGPNGEIHWFKGSDEEEKAFTHEAANQSATLIFGRTTYEMMAGYWPTPDAVKTDSVIAGVMNHAPKIVFSKTMKPVKDGPVWKHVTVLLGNRSGRDQRDEKEGWWRYGNSWERPYRTTVLQFRSHRRIPADGPPGYPGGGEIPVQRC